MDTNGKKIIDALHQLKKVIEEHSRYGTLIFSEPVLLSDVEAAEKRLRVKLPPSYVNLVTRYGRFKVLWEMPADPAEEVAKKFDTYEGFYALLHPMEIVAETLELRQAYEEETADMLRDSLCFQENRYRSDFYTFRISDARQDGEMSVHAFYHDDLYVWSDVFFTFEEHLYEWVENFTAECLEDQE